MDFGRVTIGKNNTSTLTLKNTSKAQVRLDSFWFTGPYEFTKTGGTCQLNEWRLNGGKTCTVQIRFTPTTSGKISTAFTFGYFLGKTWNWEEVTVAMAGEGVPLLTTPTPPTVPTEPIPEPAPTTGWLTVSGNKILNSAGQPVVLKSLRKTKRPFPDSSLAARARRALLNEGFPGKPYVA